jgi:hypothetical protein
MADNLQGRMAFESVAPGGIRAEVINAIADMALATRAGTLLRAYQREWAWTDQQNYRDLVDADTFNATFHDIEREFDRLAEILAQGTGPITPAWQADITLADGAIEVTVTHQLGTRNLLVDVQAGIRFDQGLRDRGVLPAPLAAAAARAADGELIWTDLGHGAIYGFALMDDDSITLGRSLDTGLPYADLFSGELALRTRIWKLG